MKKTFLIQSLLTFCFCVTLLCVSCSDGKSLQDNVKYKSIDLIVDGIEQNCPFSMGVLGEATHVELDEDVLLFEVKISDALTGIENLSDHEDLFCQAGLFSFVNDSIPFPWDDFIDLNLTLEYRFMWQNDTSEYAFVGEDLKEILEITRDEAFDDVWLENLLSINNLSAPSAVDEMTTFVGSDFLDDCIVHKYVVDEEQCDLDPLIENPEILRESVANSLFSGTSEQENILSLCKSTERNIVFSYSGNQTGKKIDIEFDYQEF